MGSATRPFLTRRGEATTGKSEREGRPPRRVLRALFNSSYAAAVRTVRHAFLVNVVRAGSARGSHGGRPPAAAPSFPWPDAFFRGKNAGRVRPTPVGMFLTTSKAAGAAPHLASWCGVFASRARPPHPARKRRDAKFSTKKLVVARPRLKKVLPLSTFSGSPQLPDSSARN